MVGAVNRGAVENKMTIIFASPFPGMTSVRNVLV